MTKLVIVSGSIDSKKLYHSALPNTSLKELEEQIVQWEKLKVGFENKYQYSMNEVSDDYLMLTKTLEVKKNIYMELCIVDAILTLQKEFIETQDSLSIRKLSLEGPNNLHSYLNHRYPYIKSPSTITRKIKPRFGDVLTVKINNTIFYANDLLSSNSSNLVSIQIIKALDNVRKSRQLKDIKVSELLHWIKANEKKVMSQRTYYNYWREAYDKYMKLELLRQLSLVK